MEQCKSQPVDKLGGSKSEPVDWIELHSKITVPIVIGLLTVAATGAGLLYTWQTDRDRGARDEIARQAREQAERIAVDNQQHQIMSDYLEQMTKLILDDQLSSPYSSNDVRSVARAITLNASRQLTDRDRKGQLLKFLYESRLLGRCDSVEMAPDDCAAAIVELKGIKLDQAKLDSSLNLMGIDLNGAELAEAQLPNIFLDKAEMQGVNLEDANLAGAILNDAQMRVSRLGGANLSSAQLKRADLTSADLQGADLRCTDLGDATLQDTKFKNAIYSAKTQLPKEFNAEVHEMIEYKTDRPENECVPQRFNRYSR